MNSTRDHVIDNVVLDVLAFNIFSAVGTKFLNGENEYENVSFVPHSLHRQIEIREPEEDHVPYWCKTMKFMYYLLSSKGWVVDRWCRNCLR